jgi:hypothetical protein
MAGKEKENKKRKGKQRLVGEMAIRWMIGLSKTTRFGARRRRVSKTR